MNCFAIPAPTDKVSGMTIAIAGATGFIGRNLIDHLLRTTTHKIIVLSRNSGVSTSERIEVRPCDLYSLLEAENALAHADIAIYLVHSMAPAASRLTQGHFEDFDFLLADNFARAALKNGIKHLLYVSGIVPAGPLSTHLSSRLEVEHTLKYRGIPLTTLRCGLVIGPQGSSYQILDRLIDRLPVMGLPAWMSTKTQVVFIDDLVKIIGELIEMGPNASGSFDVGGLEVLSYKKLLLTLKKLKNKNSRVYDLPNIPLFLSKLWVRLISGSPKGLVYPLIESLKHEMVCSPQKQLPSTIKTSFTPLLEALQKIQNTKKGPSLPVKFDNDSTVVRTDVLSVQRLHLPREWNSRDVAWAYLAWLPYYLRRFLRADKDHTKISIYFAYFKKPLLVLSLSTERSFMERQLFYITGGMLADTTSRGRLEFREGTDKKFIISA
ncbi:MAG: NAD-dependent epimerase/dehydratase family protein, partial [Bdellovibrionaceae bacterium]|nr:NAD-dependent epimerase/dehydratase family protein [Pseudobdellovibrionaceae bacterium]